MGERFDNPVVSPTGVFSSGCPEIDLILAFRDWLRTNAADRDLYARSKLALAQKEWTRVQDYAEAKTTVIEEILGRARLTRVRHPLYS
jgi:GrpB-like predicted nucleotidyltransferase (UPF0157 family)